MIWLILLTAAVLAVSYCCYWIAFYNPESRHGEPVTHSKAAQYREYLPRLRELSDRLEKLPCERLHITAHDGITLAGRYYHNRDGAPLFILFHGYRGSGTRDLCGACAVAERLGYNVLLVDQRAHGKSGGSTMTFGILERIDCQRWVHYAAERFGPDCKIILFGVSMGASTVLMASALKLPAQVAGIIGDCPFSSPGHIIRKVCADMKFPAALIYPFVVLGAAVFGHFKLWEMDCEKAVRRSKVPILLIHGEEDHFVPCEMSKQIMRCSAMSDLQIFPGAGHALCFASDEKRYEQIVQDFTKTCISSDI